jgi:hypothetical protein
MDGRPIAGLQVQLATPDGTGVASGTTRTDGSAVLRRGDGAPLAAGTYKVVLADAGEVEENPMEPPKKSSRNRVPAVYRMATSTTASVTLDGSARLQTVECRSR